VDDGIIQRQNWRIKNLKKKLHWKIQVYVKAKFTLILEKILKTLFKQQGHAWPDKNNGFR